MLYETITLSQKRKIGKMTSQEMREYVSRHTIRTDEYWKVPKEYVILSGAYLYCPRVCQAKLRYMLKVAEKRW